MSMDVMRSREKEFFKSMPQYADLSNVGTGYLAETLSKVLINEILKKLPSIQQYIDET